MLLAVLSTIVWAEEPHSPSREGSVGFGIYQVPAVSHYRRRAWPSANVHALYGVPIHRDGGWRAGLHTAFQAVPHRPEKSISIVIRFEPRVGYRIARNQAVSVDLMLGGALDIAERLRVAPVLSLTPRVRVGGEGRTFVYAEGRVAPLFWGQAHDRICALCEDQLVNPGGTGLIVGIGRVLDPL